MVETFGSISLAQTASREEVEVILTDAPGEWSLVEEDGCLVLYYEFVRKDGLEDPLETIIERGLNSDAWIEGQYLSDGADCGEIRGTEEQIKLLRLEQISEEIASLQEERLTLLGASGVALTELALPARIERALVRGGFQSVADVLRAGRWDLLRVEGLDRTNISLLREHLGCRGYDLS